MDVLKRAIIILTLGFFIILGIYFYSSNTEVRSFCQNLLTTILGILITVFLIENVISNREKREKANILKNALIQFKRPTNKLMYLLVTIYKASCMEKPSDLKESYKDLFSTDDFYSNIQFLDFKKKAPIAAHIDWSQHVSNEIKLIKDEWEKVIDKYAFVLDSKLITDIEWVKNSSFLSIFSLGPQIAASDIYLNFQRKHLCILANNQIIADLKVVLDKVFGIVDYFETKTEEIHHPGLHYDSGIWLDRIAPKVSSGRVELTIEEINELILKNQRDN